MKKEDFLKKLGKNIVNIRTQRDWSQSDLARNCDKDRQSIKRLEKGEINPSAYYLYQVANGLEITISELLKF